VPHTLYTHELKAGTYRRYPQNVPWSYEIEWQFAEPVWEEDGTGEDITYTPRPPDESQGEEIVPSTVLTGAHRLKENTSPLYL